MKRLQIVRVIGWIQLTLSVLLAAATIAVYLFYRSSLGDMSHSLANSVLSVADVITKVAATIELKQELIDDTSEVLVASRKLVTDIKASAETQGKLLPHYADTLKDASALTAEVASTMVGMSDRLMFSVPASVHFDKFKPVVNWTTPLATHAQELRKNSERAMKLSGNLAAIAGSLSTDAQKVNAGFVEVSQKTLNAIDHTTKATEKLKLSELPLALVGLKNTAESLRQASTEAKEVERLAVSLLVAGLVLAVLFAFNSVGVLLIVESLSKTTGKPAQIESLATGPVGPS
jgi:hypothetical protein